MPEALTCPNCGKVHRPRADVAGRKVRCGGCGETFRAPKADEAAGPPQRAPKPPSEFELAASEEKSEPLPPRPAVKRAEGPGSAASRAAAGEGAGWKKNLTASVLTVAFVYGLGGKIYRRYIRERGGPDAAAAAAPAAGLVRSPASSEGPIAMPPFPEVGSGRTIEPGVVLHESALPGGDAPGWGGKLWLYLPEGDHAPGSLPCVMITAAGSNLLTGASLDEGSRPEHLPYARAGFAVLAYDLDGDPGEGEPSDARFAEAVRKFLAARAGLVNASVAMEFLRAKVPQVDPGRIFAAGHSSAGTVALLFAEEEPTLKGCVAYAPATNLIERFGPALPEIDANGWGDLVRRYSPSDEARERKIACPLFLFHARGDGNVPVQDTEAFAGTLRTYGKQVRLETVPGGDHYRSMLDPGIPKAIEWLREVAGVAPSSTPPAPPPTAVATAAPATPTAPVEPYVSEEGSFRAAFPHPPRATVQDRRGPNGEDLTLHVASLDEEDVTRAVVWGATPARIATPAEAEAAIDGAVRGMSNSGNQVVDRQSPVVLGAYPGRDVYFHIPRSPGRGGRGLTRLVIAGNRLYQAIMVGPEATTADADLEAFARSFAFTEGIAAALERDAPAAEKPAEPAQPAPAPAPAGVASGDRLVPMRDRVPVELPASAAGASIAGFRFVDATGDRVGTNGDDAGRPNGQDDLHFLVELELPPGTAIDQLSLAVDDDYHRWVTRPNDRFWFLGVERDGRPAISGFAEKVGEGSGRLAFDLYAQGDGLGPGTSFRLGVALTVDGRPSEIGAVCTRP